MEKHAGTLKVQKFPSLVEIKRCLPADCFESSVTTSMYYVVRSSILSGSCVAILYWSRNSDALHGVTGIREVIAAAYILFQGVVFWGFFTIGHDCGHGSFSRYHNLNFVVGNIMHSLILTPYETWRISHRHHHKNTGNIDRDEIFYPARRSDGDLKNVRSMLYSLGVAWFTYLKYGFAPRRVPHFSPSASLFVRNYGSVVVSLSVYASVVAAYVAIGFHIGVAALVLYVLAPIFVFACFLVVVTFLHHNDEDTPWYGNSQWTYVKGNLSSVDRSYGALVNNLSHNIGTHQIHHLFPIIPHYKLNEATCHFRSAFPHLVRSKYTPIIPAFIKTAKLYVDYGEVDDDNEYFTLKQGMESKST